MYNAPIINWSKDLFGVNDTSEVNDSMLTNHKKLMAAFWIRIEEQRREKGYSLLVIIFCDIVLLISLVSEI